MKLLIYQFYKTACFTAFMLISLSAFTQMSATEFTVNGLKVILKRSQKETLVMSMYYRGGLANYTAGNAGIESLALSGIIECGNSKSSAAEFNDQADEFGLHLYGDAANDYGMVKMQCISLYAEDAWKLLLLLLHHRLLRRRNLSF